jgi:hypothetical protein
MAEHSVTLELTDSELRIVANALSAFVTDFGHDESDILRDVQHLLHRIKLAGVESGSPTR